MALMAKLRRLRGNRGEVIYDLVANAMKCYPDISIEGRLDSSGSEEGRRLQWQ